MNERRTAERFACTLDATMNSPDGAIAATTIDVSYVGICVQAPQALKPGTRVQFDLRLVFDWAASDGLSLGGTIVWCTPVGGGFQVGARFDKNLDSVIWTRLDVLLQFLSGELEIPPSQ